MGVKYYMKADSEYLWKMSSTFLFHGYSEMGYEVLERWGKLLHWYQVLGNGNLILRCSIRKQVSDLIFPR